MLQQNLTEKTSLTNRMISLQWTLTWQIAEMMMIVSCIFDLRVSNEIILWLRYIYFIPVWIPRWSTRLHNTGKVKCFNCEWYFRRVFRLQGKTGHKNWKLRRYKYLVWCKLPLSLSTASLTPPGEVKKLAGLQPPAWGWIKLLLGCSLVSTVLNSPAKVQWGVPPVTWAFTMSPGCIMVTVISDWGQWH